LTEAAAGARDARHNSADGDVEDEGDVFVLNLINVAEKQNFAELWWKLLEGDVESGQVVETDEIVFRSGPAGGVEFFWMVFEENSAGGG
jgi:hypothetical protein